MTIYSYGNQLKLIKNELLVYRRQAGDYHSGNN